MSSVNQQLGNSAAANAFMPNSAYAIPYVVRAQPEQCPVDSYVLLTHGEAQIYSPFFIDSESAVAIGGATLMLWAVAFIFRSIYKSVENSTESET